MGRTFALPVSIVLIVLALGAVPSVLSAAADGADAARRGQSTAAIEGTARGADWAPVAGYTVRVRDIQTGQLAGSAVTSAAGQFAFSGLEPGKYLLEFVSPAGGIVGASAPMTVAGGATATVTVTETATGSGRAARGRFNLSTLSKSSSSPVIAAAEAEGIKPVVAIQQSDKVTICHKPSSVNQTLIVAAAAVPAHLAHGDFIGPCIASSPR
jgi:hypothetical protein